MSVWLVIAGVVGAGLVVGLLSPRKPAPQVDPAPAARSDEPLWTPDALARLGTPETVADLVAQGRADELRGLGYQGELPPE